MSDAGNLLSDVEELQRLLAQAERQRVKDILGSQIKKIQDEISILQHPTPEQDKQPKFVIHSKPSTTTNEERCYEVKLTNYAWDQSDKFVKIYITLKDVDKISKDNVKCHFTTKSFELSVNGLNNKNYSLLLPNLLEPIIPDASHYKIKSDSLTVFLKKESSKHWSNIASTDKKTKDPKLPKMDEDADPSKGLMDMMKQMYDEGDDEMKRSIAKAWTESRNKTPDFDI